MANEELLADLVARIRTVFDDSGAKKADAAVKNLGKTLDDHTKGPSSRFANVQNLLQNKLQSFAGSSNIATKGLGDLSKAGILSGEALSTGLAGGAAIAGAVIAKLATDGIGKFVSLTAEIRGFNRVAGTSAEEGSKLVGALHLLGIEPAVVDKAFGILSKTIVNNSGKLNDLGIEVARTKAGNADLVGTLFNVSDAFNRTHDQAVKNTIALTAFGKGGLALVPILARGREGIEELFKATGKSGLIFDQAALERGRQFSLAGKELKESFSGLEISIGEKLVPLLTAAARDTTTLTDGITQIVDKLGSLKIPGDKNSFLSGAGKDLKLIGEGLPGVNLAIGFLDSKQKDAKSSGDKLKATQKDIADALQETAKQADANAKALDDLVNAQLGQFDAHVAYERAIRGVEDANARVRDAEKAAADAVRQHGASSVEALQAHQNLTDAYLNEESAASSMAAAAKKWTEQAAAANQQTANVNDVIDSQVAALQQLADETSGPAKTAIQELIATLVGVKSKDITIGVNTSAAYAKIAALGQALSGLSGPTGALLTLIGMAGQAGVKVGPGRASGGPVMPGVAYPVNEKGSEIFVAAKPGGTNVNH